MTPAIAGATPATSSWRHHYPVHPCADVYPMMPEPELAELAEDIRKHGLQKPIVLWRSGPEQPWQVIDGRNRLEALTRMCVIVPPITNGTMPDVRMPDGSVRRDVFMLKHDTTIDPASYVISANIERRHLTKEQRADLILQTIKAGQTKNDRAKSARSFNPTPSKKGGSTKDPVLAQAVEEAQKHGISKRTVQNARAKLQGKPKPTPKPKQHARPMPTTQHPKREVITQPNVAEISAQVQMHLIPLQVSLNGLVVELTHALAEIVKCWTAADRPKVARALTEMAQVLGTLQDQLQGVG